MTDPRFSSSQEVIYKALSAGGPGTASDLVTRTGRDRNSVYKALRSLHLAGYIAVAGTYTDGSGKDAMIWEVVQ